MFGCLASSFFFRLALLTRVLKANASCIVTYADKL